jgi:hypothetical protein
MARRQVCKLHSPTDKKYILADKDGVRPFAHETCESCIDLAAGAGVEDVHLQSEGAGSRFQVSQRGFCRRDIGWIDEHGNTSCSGHQFTQEFQPLCRQLIADEVDPRQIATGSGNAGDKAKPHRVFGHAKDDRDCRGCRLGRERRRGTSSRNYDGDLSANQFRRQLRQSVDLIAAPAVLNANRLALDIAGIGEALAEFSSAAPL